MRAPSRKHKVGLHTTHAWVGRTSRRPQALGSRGDFKMQAFYPSFRLPFPDQRPLSDRRLEGAKIHDERDRNRGLHGAVRTLGGAAYYSRAAARLPTKENTTGARADAPSRSCRCAKALTETHPGVRDWLSATRICMQSKLGTPMPPDLRAAPRAAPRARMVASTVLYLQSVCAQVWARKSGARLIFTCSLASRC